MFALVGRQVHSFEHPEAVFLLHGDDANYCSVADLKIFFLKGFLRDNDSYRTLPSPHFGGDYNPAEEKGEVAFILFGKRIKP
ncbi:hypothetical protein J4419_00990 [Candidatus Woesearchaeota archaeon]|nr:hypothetical protein [Candidatus Woesearchaeota archaeon]